MPFKPKEKPDNLEGLKIEMQDLSAEIKEIRQKQKEVKVEFQIWEQENEDLKG